MKKKHFLFMLLFVGCNSAPEKDLHSLQVSDTAAKTIETPRPAKPKQPKRLFDNHLPFEILSVTDEYEDNSTDTDTARCRNWKISNAAIRRIVKNSVPIEGTIWDFDFLVLACEKSVNVVQGGERFKLYINAASFFHAVGEDTTVLFGDYKKSDRKYFIEAPSEAK